MKGIPEDLKQQILNKEITQKAAAEQLGVTARHLRRVLPLPKAVPLYERKTQRQKAQSGKRKKTEAAAEIHKGNLTAEQAAKILNCSLRTVYRHLAKYRSTTKQEEERWTTQDSSKPSAVASPEV